jgi:hypothetical protein
VRAGGAQEEDLIRILGLPASHSTAIGKQGPRLNFTSARETAAAVRHALAQPSSQALIAQASGELNVMRSFIVYLLR